MRASLPSPRRPARLIPLLAAALCVSGCGAWYGYGSPSPGEASPTPTAEVVEGCGGEALGYPDADGDGYGDARAPGRCGEGVADRSDCDDGDASIHPGAEERCDGEDDDCDGVAEQPTTFYPDLDTDGYGAGAPVLACERPELTSPVDGDCDDGDPLVSPGARERCADGIDGDCDGVVDEDGPVVRYVDDDGDGFGGAAVLTCYPSATELTTQGDCDDADPSIHPGAPDPRGDGVDSDCGGRDETDPHVGYGAGSRETIAEALSVAQNGMTVWVGPGTYPEVNLSFSAKILSLRASHGASETVIDGQSQGTLFLAQNGETRDALVEGFTLRGGDAGAGAGGAVYISHASPTFRGCVIGYSRAGRGGGVYVQNGGPALIDCDVRFNRAELGGGGLDLHSAQLSLQGATLLANRAPDGGGFAAAASDLDLVDTVLLSNLADGDGGAGLIDVGSLSAVGGAFAGNRAEGDGGGLALFSAGIELSGVAFTGNQAHGDGGGMRIDFGEQHFDALTLLGNGADGVGGGLLLRDGSVALEGARVESNTAGRYGGGIALVTAFGMVSDAALTGNRTLTGDYTGGGGLFVDTSGMYLVRSRLRGNVAAGTFGQGGGMYVRDAAPVVSSCIFTQNQATAQGGGAFLLDSSPPLLFSAFTANVAAEGGGIYLLDRSAPTVDSSVLAYNLPNNQHLCCFEPERDAPAPYYVFSSVYNPAGRDDVAPPYYDPGAGNLFGAPAFFAYEGGIPVDHHLATTSPLIGRGDPSLVDADGSPADIGPYGGPEGGGWDLDGDGLPAHYWPGAAASPPAGVEGSYDCDDDDPSVGACP